MISDGPTYAMRACVVGRSGTDIFWHITVRHFLRAFIDIYVVN